MNPKSNRDDGDEGGKGTKESYGLYDKDSTEYDAVKVLLLNFCFHDLGCRGWECSVKSEGDSDSSHSERCLEHQIKEVEARFKELNYETRNFRIPEKEAFQELKKTLDDFLGDANTMTLLVIYYAGHGWVDERGEPKELVLLR
jgi:hypothetical protein